MRGRRGSGLTDLHSHLVPGVDDGARDVEEAIAAVGRLADVGYGTLATTPHFNASLTLDPPSFRKRMDELDEGWDLLEGAVRANHPDVTLHRGQEVMLDVPNPDLSDRRLRLAGGPWVLVEWPRFQVPPATNRVLGSLSEAGVRPLIAHPERYHGIDPELRIVERWRSVGASLQVNLGSLVGRYGEGARTLAFRLLRRGWVTCLGSDYHARPHLELHVTEARSVLEGVEGEEQWELLTATNPGRILRGETPLPVPELTPRGGFWNRLKGILGWATDSGTKR